MYDFISLARDSGYLCFDIEYDSSKYDTFRDGFQLHGVSFASLRDGDIVSEYVTDFDRVREIIDATFPDQGIKIIAHSAKGDLNCLKRVGLYPCDPNICCTLVAANILDDTLNPKQLGLKPLVKLLYDHQMEEYKVAASRGLDHPQFHEYAREDSYWELRLFLDMEQALEDFKGLYYDILMPSLLVFSDMEIFGIHWDQDIADEFYRKLFHARKKLEQKIYAKIGRLNLGSSQQLSRRLFDELNYTTKYTDRGKSGEWRLDADVLDQLAKKYEVCNWIRAYRSCEKLINTYLEPIQTQYHVNHDHRIHSNYFQDSKTGRTRCSNVNNQNMPVSIGDDLGKVGDIFQDVKIRAACNAPKGRKLAVADFSQLELRLAGHVIGEPDFVDSYCDWECHQCGDNGSDREILHKCPTCGCRENPNALKEKKGFWQGKDLHTEVLEKIPEKLRKNLKRSDGKVLNFAIIYNASCWRLHYEHPQLSPDQWQEILNAIMDARPMAKQYHEDSKRLLRSRGERDDCFGRRRRIPKSQYTVNGRFDAKKFKHALNEFINFPIQGPGSTLCQLAMVKIRKLWIEKGWWGEKVFLVNMIHDELVAEADEDIIDEVLQDMIYCMETAAKFNVPIRAEGSVYDSWDQAK